MPISKTEAKKVRALQSKKGRKAHGRFVAEGVRLLEEACRFRIRPAELFFSEAIVSERGRRLAVRFQKMGITPRAVAAAELKRMAGTEAPQGLLAVFDAPVQNLSELYRPSMRNALMCENLSDPGNVGTLIRSAAAFDFDLVILCERSAEPYSPKVVRASVGAVFGIPIAVTTTAEALDYLARKKFALVASALNGRAGLKRVLARVKDRRMALAIGSEADGLSQIVLDQAYSAVRIQHSRRVESLNSAMAGSILMKECYDSRARRKK